MSGLANGFNNSTCIASKSGNEGCELVVAEDLQNVHLWMQINHHIGAPLGQQCCAIILGCAEE